MSIDSTVFNVDLPTSLPFICDDGVLNQCFSAISQLLMLDVVELWARGSNGLLLHHDYRSNDNNPNSTRCIHNIDQSKNLCELAFVSLNGFYSKEIHCDTISGKQSQSMIAFSLPRANINIDVFIVCYASKSMKFNGSKLKLLFWLSHSLSAVAFTPTAELFDTDIDNKPNGRCDSPRRSMAIVALQSSTFPDNVNDEVKEDSNEGAQHIRYNKQIVVPGDNPTSPKLPLLHTIAPSIAILSYKDPVQPSLGSTKDDNSNRSSTKSLRSRQQNPYYNEGNDVMKNSPYASDRNDDEESITYNGNGEGVIQNGANIYYNKGGGGSVCSSVGPSSNNTMGTALTSVTGATHKLKISRSTRLPKYFDFNIIELPLLRNINRRVDLNEMVSLEYVTDGSHSQVYSAVWNNQPVVVKILSELKAHHTMAIHEFDVECELLTRLNHPNIASILGGGVIPRPFIVMERLRDVAGLLNLAAQESNPTMFRNKTFKFIEVLHLSRDLAIALKYLHSDFHKDAMILHRDLKPENLGLDPNGKLKLFDFGLCRCVFKRGNENQLYEMTGNTGSLRYMAPEVVLGQPYTEKVDVYSFAMIMWTFAKSKSPFKGFDRAMHRARVVINGERPKLDPDWPMEFMTLLDACWSQQDSLRPDFVEIEIRLDEMIELFSKDKDRDSTSLKSTTKGLNFLKTIFTKR